MSTITAMTSPPHTARNTSFAKAHQARLDRLEILRKIKDGDQDPIPMLIDTPEALQSVFVFDFLRSIPRVGPSRIRELNRRAVHQNVNLAVALGDLGTSKAEWLICQLDRRWGERRHPRLSRRPQG